MRFWKAKFKEFINTKHFQIYRDIFIKHALFNIVLTQGKN